MIRLAFGSTPRKVRVRLGTATSLSVTPVPQRPAVSCIWDKRLRSRPRRLRLATRTASLIQPRMSSYHGRYLYA